MARTAAGAACTVAAARIAEGRVRRRRGRRIGRRLRLGGGSGGPPAVFFSQSGHSVNEGGTSRPHCGQIHVNMCSPQLYCSACFQGTAERPVSDHPGITIRRNRDPIIGDANGSFDFLFVLLGVFSGHCRRLRSDIPHLRKQGTATQLIVDGKPFLALAGELSNSSPSSVEYTKPIWPMLAAAKLNTVLAGVYWSQIEPQEGKFDFSIPDGLIREARSQNLRLVLLWFASWKNGLSGYPPDWVKRDFQRFPRAQIVGGHLARVRIRAAARPDRREQEHRTAQPLRRCHAGRRCARLCGPDAARQGCGRPRHTVITIQVENEVGMQGDTRDRSPAANKAFDGPVPKELMDYLQQHKDTLIPELRKVWEAAGFNTSGTWEEVFGKGRPTDEIFMAWHFARFVGRVVDAGKAEYPIPMFTNCPQSGFGRRATQRRTERWPYARRDGRLESRGAANRFIRARHLWLRLPGVERTVHPVREPALRTRDVLWAGRRGQSALRLRTP